MRLGFSTLGCSGDPLDRVAALAASSGWLGVELRAADGEPVHVGRSAAQRAAARDLLATAGVAVISVASYVRVADPAADHDTVVADLVAHADLAHDVGAPFVRVFPGGGEAGSAGDDVAVGRLRDAAAAIEGRNVVLALETHDSHRRGGDVGRILDRVDDGRVQAIWDALHPWLAGEAVAETAAALRGRLAYLQIKDVASRTDLTPVLPGSGVVPLAEIAAAAMELDDDAWVSLEWESKWFPAAPPLAEAIDAASALVTTWAGYPSPGRPSR